MDIKEIGACGVFVVGGTIYGVSQFGLNDVLSEDLVHISEISRQERPAYMDKVVAEFDDAFETYGVQTETYTFVGTSHFSTAPASGTFTEVVRQDTAVPRKEIKALRAVMEESDFCAQDEMTMFTENGWTYSFSLKDSKGQKLFKINCTPLKLRTS